MNNYDDLIKLDNIEDAKSFLHIKKRRTCIKCKGSLKGSKNAYYCLDCLKKQEDKQKELKASQAFYKENPHLIPKGVLM